MHFLAFLLFLRIVLTEERDERLKLRVVFQQNLPNRKIDIGLNVKFDDGHEIFGRKLLNGKNVDFEVPPNGQNKEKIVLKFVIVMKPNKSEYVPSNERENNNNNNNNGPNNDTTPNRNANAIRSSGGRPMAMRRNVEVALYKPNFSKRYVVNLGNLEPIGIFWNRKILIEPKNGDENSPAENYQAFLYASVSRNLSLESDERIYEKLLGYAPLAFLRSEMPTKIEENGTEQQNKRLLEFNLKIPINLQNLFKHEIWALSIYLYRFDENESKNSKKKGAADEMDKKANGKNGNDLTEEICAICLDSLQSKEKEKQKLHLIKGKKHEFHRICIKKWIEYQEKIQCPLCKMEPQLSVIGEFSPIFSASSDPPLALYKNAFAELFRRAQSADNAFVRAQSQFALALIVRQIGQAETKVRNLLANLRTVMAQIGEDESPLFGVENDTFGVNAKLERIIRNVLSSEGRENSSNNLRNSEQFSNALELIRWAEIFCSTEANEALESMQMISEAETDDGTRK